MHGALLTLMTSKFNVIYVRFLDRLRTEGLPTIMTIRTSFIIACITMWVTACATSEGPRKTGSRPTTPTVALTGANGDMNKYLGTWISNCAPEYRVTQDGRGARSSATNSFSFSSVSGSSVRGTLAIDTYESPDCSGPGKRMSAEINMTYVGNIPVNSSFGEGVYFSGAADKLTASATGTSAMDGSNTFNIGFLDGFGSFRLAPLDYFSSTNLVYTKKP
ncbi:MAG: hypothetical protein V7642_2596 [Burkholderiales bacterium]|jgi:hypothetical protein